MKATEILSYFQDRQHKIVDAIRDFVEIESPSYDVDASRAIADWVEHRAVDIDAFSKIERIPAERFGEHVVIRAFGSERKGILLVGHTDTVHPVGTKEKNPTRIEEDRFYGCGIFDMKANVVLMLEILRFLSEAGIAPARPITVFLACDEEVGSLTGREIVEREALKAEFCLVCEPSATGRVKTGRKGTGIYAVKAHGRPAHAGLEPERGASAILEITRQIEKLHSLNNRETGTTVNVCMISGGTAANVIPEKAECSVDVRFTSLAEAERINAAIHGIKSCDPRVSLEVTGGINRPPLERTSAVVALYEKTRQHGFSFGYDVGETQVGGASDGNFIAALGVPVLDGLGIAGDGAHTLNEYIYISDIARRGTLLSMMLI